MQEHFAHHREILATTFSTRFAIWFSICESQAVNVISRQRLYEFIEAHRDAESSLAAWYSLTKKAEWKHLAELKMDYPNADLVGDLTVFNIKGNNYRMIAYVNYRFKEVLIKAILTHREYDEGKWKQ